ncbi:pseudouridine synthase deg1, partial [Massospora cicadina]
MTIVTTVEDYIFAALENCRLVADAKNLDLSRCGRTDKGVSGLSQVLVLSLRSALTKEQLEHNPLMVEGELAYIDMINKSLPEDIRVLSWAPVPASFNARFDCKSRSYKYFFTTDGTGLKLERMKEACEYLVGSHDFRNFCRQDGSKQITTFVRDIMRHVSNPRIFHILRPQLLVEDATSYLSGAQELEHPSLVKELLNVEELKQKPSYDLACPYPLVLFDCTYDISLKMANRIPIIPRSFDSRLPLHIHPMFLDRSQGEAGLTHLLDSDSSTIHLVMGGGNDTYVRRYIPIMKRPRTQPIEVINKRYLDRKIAKLESRKKAESDNHDNEKSAP